TEAEKLHASPTLPRSVTQNIAMHGRLFEEGRMLALARVLESRFDVWRGRRPPVDGTDQRASVPCQRRYARRT
ncbi:MAG TPA: hypothetical protein VJ921_12370, partial [Vicinamibacteria bacterium]|nr:hypothetical protein [Vicinamibacteria bacterium]